MFLSFLKQEFSQEISRLDAEKETMEQTLVLIQTEYKEAKSEAQVSSLILSRIAIKPHDKLPLRFT